MGLRERIADDLKEAMKSRDADRVSGLRMLRSAILNLEKEGKGDPTDGDVLRVLQGQAKQRAESIEQYRAGGREELAAREEVELALIRTYLPEEASDAEIAAAVRNAMVSSGATSIKEMGRVIGAALKALKATGKSVDGARVNAAVKSALGG